MRVCIIRHSLAENQASTDSERRLTEKGKQRAKQLADILKLVNILPTLIYTSPYLRAHETAQILSSHLHSNNVEIRHELKSGSDLIQTLSPLMKGKESDSGTVFLVGHQPDISNLVGELLGTSREIISVSPATALYIELVGWRRSGGILQNMIQGELL